MRSIHCWAGGSASLAGTEGGVLVVIQQPDTDLVPVTIGVKPIGEGTGMGADHLVHPVLALARFGEQVLAVQGLQGAAGAGQASAVQGGSGEGVDVGARVQPEPPEQPVLLGMRSS